MSKFKKIVKKVASSPIGKIALPIIGTAVAPGIGTALGSSLASGTLAALGSAAGGALAGGAGGGGLKGALLGGGLGYVGGGGLGTISKLGVGGMGPPTAGSGILGAMTRGSGALSSALRTGANALSGAASTLLPTTASAGTGGAFSNALNLGRIAGNAYSAVQGSDAYKNMERAQIAANKQSLGAVSPFMQSGQAANTRLSALLGLGGEDQDDVLETLRSSPGYQFRLDQGQRALDRSLGARGQLFSGRALQETQNLGQGLADQTYNDYVRNLMQQSGQGMQAAGGVSNLYGQQGDIRANSILGRSNLMNRSLANVFGQPYEEMQ